jgi:hypothetical protein
MDARFVVIAALTVVGVVFGQPTGAADSPYQWHVVANNGTYIPDVYERTFNSYGQPSVSFNGTVVFRGRSTGASTGPVRGIYARGMEDLSPLRKVAEVGGPVPQPNNIMYGGLAASFNEFPSFPRIDIASTTIVTRGQSRPVWRFGPEGAEEHIGTAGVYFERNRVFGTGASQLGVDPRQSHFQVPVPGAAAGIRFEQFPGAPTVTNREVIAFKGNYTDGTAHTGVFVRNVRTDGGLAPVQLVASSQATTIPGSDPQRKFGSTAPPSAAGNYVYFVGSDNETNPTVGGIYRAAIKTPSALEALVTIGTQVPGESQGIGFARFGESLSIGGKGRHVAFWASWSEDDYTSTIFRCPSEGNKNLIAYCKTIHPDGAVIERAAHQGIFVYDTKTKAITVVAKTGQGGIEQFQFCIYSGRPPGASSGHEGGGSDDAGDEGEDPRWRCSAFAALSGVGTEWHQVAYKATRNSKDGVYLWDSRPGEPVTTALETGMNGRSIDSLAPEGSTISTLGIERDGFRKGWLALTASMAAAPVTTEVATEEEAEGWAGVYVTRIPGWEDPALTLYLLDSTIP